VLGIPLQRPFVRVTEARGRSAVADSRSTGGWAARTSLANAGTGDARALVTTEGRLET
jgi:hypothetical protein